MFNQALFDLLWEGTVDTLYMTLASTFFSYVFGMVMAVVLVLTRADGIKPHPVIFRILDVVVNLTRSFPFLILMIAVIPFTRWLVGTTIGNNATIVPLVIAAILYGPLPAGIVGALAVMMLIAGVISLYPIAVWVWLGSIIVEVAALIAVARRN